VLSLQKYLTHKYMATPIRFAPVLVGNEAVKFYERWYETIDKPDPTKPSKEELAELEEFFRNYELQKLQKRFK
jgi:hypothetical protein